jgi:hypothetical protein
MRFSTTVSDHLRSNVIGYVAVFIALSGTAYAIDGPLPGQNQVGSEDIIDGEVKTSDLGGNSVATGKIANGQVQSADLADSVISDDTLNPLTGSTKIAAGAVKASELGDSSVFSSEVAPNVLKGEDIATNAIGGLEVADQSLGSVDLGPGSVGSSEIANGTVERIDLDEEAQGPAGYERRSSDTGQICNGGCTEGSLSLPPGFYAIFGKIEVVQQDFDEDLMHVSCELTSGGVVFDKAFFRLVGDDSGSPGATAGATLSMQGLRLLLERGNVNLNCNDSNVGDVNGLELNLTAIKLGTATSSVAPPGD